MLRSNYVCVFLLFMTAHVDLGEMVKVRQERAFRRLGGSYSKRELAGF